MWWAGEHVHHHWWKQTVLKYWGIWVHHHSTQTYASTLSCFHSPPPPSHSLANTYTHALHTYTCTYAQNQSKMCKVHQKRMLSAEREWCLVWLKKKQVGMGYMQHLPRPSCWSSTWDSAPLGIASACWGGAGAGSSPLGLAAWIDWRTSRSGTWILFHRTRNTVGDERQRELRGDDQDSTRKPNSHEFLSEFFNCVN